MKAIFILVASIFMTVPLFSQRIREVSVGPLQDAQKVFKPNDRYRFQDFKEGYLITPAGKRSQSFKLNFNLFSGLPQFIDKKGDTLFLDDQIARYVHMKETTYLNGFSKHYYEIILNAMPVKLAIQREWRLARVETEFTDRSGEKAINISRDGKNQIYSPSLGRMVRNENKVYQRDSTYFFVDKNERIYKANENNFTRLFTDHKKKIENYLKEESIDFKKEEDLTKIFGFVSML